MPFCGYSLPELFWKLIKTFFSTITLRNDCDLDCTLMPITFIMQLLHAFFSAGGNIVRIDSCTDDSIRISLTVGIRLIGAPVNRYTPNADLVHWCIYAALGGDAWMLWCLGICRNSWDFGYPLIYLVFQECPIFSWNWMLMPMLSYHLKC